MLHPVHPCIPCIWSASQRIWMYWDVNFASRCTEMHGCMGCQLNFSLMLKMVYQQKLNYDKVLTLEFRCNVVFFMDFSVSEHLVDKAGGCRKKICGH